MERRDFIKNACLACGALAIMRLAESCEKNVGFPAVSLTVSLTDPAFSALNSVGGYAYINEIIIMCTAPNTFHALSKVCTHAGCTVQYDNTKMDIVCLCHNGVYNLNGNVISGPPPTSLRVFKVVQNGNTLTISG